MKSKIVLPVLVFLLSMTAVFAQADQTAILKTILQTYYKTEKPVYKGRNQILFLYCEKPDNNEEIYEAISQLKLPDAEVKSIKNQVVTDNAPQNWSASLAEITAADKTQLKAKVNACIGLDEYHEKQKRFNLNNQRMIIISKPIFFSGNNKALVKVVFYRSIDHNSGSVLLFEKSGGNWIIKESLNHWST